jgi:replication initiation and membrane attachment protein DnaB
METKIRVALEYFLKQLLKKMEFDMVSTMNPVFLTVFSKKELRAILHWLFDGNVFQGFETYEMTKEELLEAIGNEQYLLLYMMEEWKKEQEQVDLDCNEAFLKISKQLGLETHYLAEKPFSTWDSFDKKNFNDLVRKAGKLIPKYGIFDASIKEEDKHNLPSYVKRYDSEWEAQVVISMLIADGGFNDGDLKVMTL